MNYNLIIYLLIMILVTNLLRVLPMILIRKQIKNRFIQSFLYYVPYVTLAVMTVPAIFEATTIPIAGVIALAAGILAAWFGLNLFCVATVCCLCVFIAEFVLL